MTYMATMDSGDLRRRIQELYDRSPLIGSVRRRRAAQLLAGQETPAAARALAEAVAASDDPSVREIALRSLRERTDPAAIDAICGIWVSTRHDDLESLIVAGHWAAVAPPSLAVLTGLKTKALRRPIGPEMVKPLIQACEDTDPEIAAEARMALRSLDSEKAREALCQVVIETEGAEARRSAVGAMYSPQDPQRRALFYFMTEQWAEYESLDFDHSLLQAAYELASPQLRTRIAARARHSGRVEWVEAVAGGRQGRRLASMTDAEWESALSVLSLGERWADLWRLAQDAPPRWSARMLKRLTQARWSPQSDAESAGFNELARLAHGWNDPRPGTLMRQKTAFISDEPAPQEPVQCVAISPDGRLLVSGGRYGTIRIWSLASGEEKVRLDAHEHSVQCVAISPDSKILVSGSGDTTIKLWNLPGGTPITTLEGHTDWVLGVAIGLEQWLLASGSGDGTVRLWNIRDGRSLHTLRGHTGGVTAVAIGRDGGTLATASHDRTVRLWRLPDGTLTGRLEHDNPVSAVAIGKDGRTIAAGCDNGSIYLWNPRGKDPSRVLQGHSSGVSSLVMTPSLEVLASAGYDHRVRLWSLPDGAELTALRAIESSASSLAISPDGWLLAIGHGDGAVSLWVWELARLSQLPVRLASAADLEWVQQTVGGGDLSVTDRSSLVFLEALMRWRRRYDITVEESSGRMGAGEFDIEIELLT